MGHSDTDMGTVRAITALGLLSLVTGQVISPVPVCSASERCTVQWRGMGQCVDMRTANISTLPVLYDLRAGAVDNVCNTITTFPDCCRCLKLKNCKQTRDCVGASGRCYTKGRQPNGTILLDARCDESKDCYCYGRCPQTRDCQGSRGRCYKEGFQPPWSIPLDAECDKDKDCYCYGRCPRTEECKELRGNCYKKGSEPIWAVPLDAKCDEDKDCYCYGKCPVTEECKELGGSCFKEGSQPNGAARLDARCDEDKDCHCYKTCRQTRECRRVSGRCIAQGSPVPAGATVNPGLCSDDCQCVTFGLVSVSARPSLASVFTG